MYKLSHVKPGGGRGGEKVSGLVTRHTQTLPLFHFTSQKTTKVPEKGMEISRL